MGIMYLSLYMQNNWRPMLEKKMKVNGINRNWTNSRNLFENGKCMKMYF